jgi:hypothetical protein
MNNYFYYSRNPYIESIPSSFYNINRQLIRPSFSNGFNFNYLLTTAQKGINTINQIIPLYKQVKPIYQQAKTSFNTIKKYIKPTMNKTIKESKQVYNTVQNSSFNYQSKGPSKPYFK